MSAQGGGCLPGEVSAQWGCLPRGVGAVCPGDVCPGGICPGGCLPGGVSARHPPVDRMTVACENITLPQLRCGR